ncbi:Flp family type IVb pilin [Blastococcus sp. TBT05-19]|uniref:Flp family type IVb pilin n=1 Tax=Blastococcus sp. TBT05-19 TaxID=2250581 RepID=UPI000DE9F9E9|nr:Flp family type IVb pilin [Blastococcus sp. TBT05-19]RBY94867.1 Flp family type IVb pilin [Blastococcus sp. TBT05-19]
MLNPFTALTTFVSFAQARLRTEEKGATAVEYGLMVGLIAIAIILAVTTLGTELSGLFDGIGDELGDVPVGGAAPAAG